MDISGNRANFERARIKCGSVLFFVAMNMMFFDYGKTLAKHNVNSVNLYIDLAMDWIEDDDVAAGKEKTTDYYYCVVK